MRVENISKYYTIIKCLNIIFIALISPIFSFAEDNLEIPEKTFRLNIVDGLISLESRNAGLREILSAISRECDIQIEVDPKVKDDITVIFHNLTVEEALKRLAGNRINIYVKSQDDDIYRIWGANVLASQHLDNERHSKNHPPVPNVMYWFSVNWTNPICV